jgi:hypothetical protein
MGKYFFGIVFEGLATRWPLPKGPQARRKRNALDISFSWCHSPPILLLKFQALVTDVLGDGFSAPFGPITPYNGRLLQ